MSAAAAGCGGALYAAGQLKPAVCFLLLYSVYSAWSRGGVRVVALCAVLAFVTSDILLYVMADELSKDGGAARRRSAWSAGSSRTYPVHARAAAAAAAAAAAPAGEAASYCQSPPGKGGDAAQDSESWQRSASSEDTSTSYASHAADSGSSSWARRRPPAGAAANGHGAAESGSTFGKYGQWFWRTNSAGFRRAAEGEHRHGFSRSNSAPSSPSEDVPDAAPADGCSPEEEIARLLTCHDHYAVLGFSKYSEPDSLDLKREYRRKAMLVHPDKNQGNMAAEEAFKRLQNAFEVLSDETKRDEYDELEKAKEFVERWRNGHSQASLQSLRCPCQTSGISEDSLPEGSTRTACSTCGESHIWVVTDKEKTKARWCQDCQELHAAKDGDGWVEQSSTGLFFNLLRKPDEPRSFACSDGVVYDISEWGMVCPPNTHKPSFQVSTTRTTAGTGKGGGGKNGGRAGGGGRGSGARDGGRRDFFADLDDNMTAEDFAEWYAAAVAGGAFDGAEIPHRSVSGRHSLRLPMHDGGLELQPARERMD
eukprot:SM000128S26236  [mRNA]  locus=s128:228855:233299:- [translate_table: standard]